MNILPVEPGDIEPARQRLLAGGWQRCVADPAAFRALLAQSRIAIDAREDGAVVAMERPGLNRAPA